MRNMLGGGVGEGEAERKKAAFLSSSAFYWNAVVE